MLISMTIHGLNVMEPKHVNRVLLKDNFVLIFVIGSLLERETPVDYYICTMLLYLTMPIDMSMMEFPLASRHLMSNTERVKNIIMTVERRLAGETDPGRKNTITMMSLPQPSR